MENLGAGDHYGDEGGQQQQQQQHQQQELYAVSNSSSRGSRVMRRVDLGNVLPMEATRGARGGMDGGMDG